MGTKRTSPPRTVLRKSSRDSASAGRGSPSSSACRIAAKRGRPSAPLPARPGSRTTAEGKAGGSKTSFSFRSARRSSHIQCSMAPRSCSLGWSRSISALSISVCGAVMGPSERKTKQRSEPPKSSSCVAPQSSGSAAPARPTISSASSSCSPGGFLQIGARSGLGRPPGAALKCIRSGEPFVASSRTEQKLGTPSKLETQCGLLTRPRDKIATSHSSTERISRPAGQPAAPNSNCRYADALLSSALFSATLDSTVPVGAGFCFSAPDLPCPESLLGGALPEAFFASAEAACSAGFTWSAALSWAASSR
mmetsp:Transcript_82679/g.229932  ORF Transcript_82679/g.229932 Transcript_82679/m.229932 type:complete len:308 (+) Transcript_82679:118-1041(+)